MAAIGLTEISLATPYLSEQPPPLTMPLAPRGHSSFYEHIALFPDLGNFRRFGPNWAKKVHDETSEVIECLVKLEDELRACPNLGVTTVLDFPRRYLRKIESEYPEKYQDIKSAWNEYNEALVRHGETLCMTARIMNLPRQNKYYTKKMKEFDAPKFQPLYDEQLQFVPTGEPAAVYQNDPETTDTCACTATPPGDLLTKVFLRIGPWAAEHVVPRWRKLIHRKGTREVPDLVSLPTASLITIFDTLACIIASGMLAATIVVLVNVRPLRIRIGVIVVFGTLFTLLLKIMAGTPSRGEIFGSAAAFYAVAAVFVGSLNSDCACS